MAHPITSLQNKGVDFQWTPWCEESFHKLKRLLTNTPILTIVDLNEYCVVCTYAFQEGIGGVLYQLL